jgi:predicted metal-dependent hydrolase
MNRDSLFIIVLTIFVVSIATKMFLESEAFNLKCIVSSENGNTYCVRERTKIHEVVDLLAKTSDKMEYLIEKLKVKYPQRENVKRLVDKCNPKKIMETLPSSKYTAYSENKGQKMAFCVTTEKSNNNLIDENTLFFVALHEMAHVSTVSVGHNEEFWNNFRFLIHNAKELNLYQPENYKKHPKPYCGMTISDNPYFDM